MARPGRVTPHHEKVGATQCPLFGRRSFSEAHYIQQLTRTEGWTILVHPVSGRTNTAFESSGIPRTAR
jgi:hypothetical protein